MSNSVHLALRDAVVAALLAGTPLAGGRVAAGRRRPMPSAEDSRIFVYLEEAPADNANLASAVEWQTRVRLECVARNTSLSTAEDAADALATAAYARLMADRRWGGIAIDTTCHLAWTDDDSGGTDLCAAQVLAIIRHRTPRASVAV